MKITAILSLITFIAFVGCSNKDEVAELKLKSGPADTTITVYSDGNGVEEIFFDSAFVVNSLSVSYSGGANQSQRMAIAQFSDNNYVSVLQDDETGYALPQKIYNYIEGTHTITHPNLNKRTDYILLWAQAYTGLQAAFTITGHYSTDDEFEVITVYMNDDEPSKVVEFNDDYNIVSIKAQRHGFNNTDFHIENDNLTIDIDDESSVHNIKDFAPNQVSNELTFTVDVDPNEWSFWFFTIVVEK